MSIARIESVYKTFGGHPEKLTSTQMSVLLALAYCDNYKGKGCFPGRASLQHLTLFKDSAVDAACTALKKAGIITWKRRMSPSGDPTSNLYTFLFPLKPVDNSYANNKYESPLGHDTGEGTPPNGPTYLVSRPDLPRQVAKNTEDNTQIKSEEECGRGVEEPSPTFDVGSVFKSVGGSYRVDTRKDAEDLTTKAIRICKRDPKDAAERKSFSMIISMCGQENAAEEINTLESELRQGEHRAATHADSLPRILMSRLKKRIPADSPVRPIAEKKLADDFGV